jgi:hypothetical protein
MQLHGMLTVARKAIPAKLLSKMYDTSTAVNYHAKAGRLEKDGDKVRLSATGLDYFKDRAKGGNVNRQIISSEHVAALVELIKTGKKTDALKGLDIGSPFKITINA